MDHSVHRILRIFVEVGGREYTGLGGSSGVIDSWWAYTGQKLMLLGCVLTECGCLSGVEVNPEQRSFRILAYGF